jgi:plastocyanin
MKAIRGNLGRGRASVAVTAAVAALLLFAASPGSSASMSSVATASRAKTVDIHNFAFHPRTLEIGKGTKVVFSNSSAVAHTATRRGVFDTHRIKPGHSVGVRFEQRGTFPYHCKIHPEMHGKIVVG